MLILGAAFYVVATSSVSLVGNYLFNDKINQELEAVQRLAMEYADLFARGDSVTLYQKARQASVGGSRIVILDMDAKVQVDSSSQLNGMRLGHPEVVNILNGSNLEYGFYRIQSDTSQVEGRAPFDFVRNLNTGRSWAGYFTAALTSGNEKIGVVLYSVKVQDIADELRLIQDQILMYFFLAAIGVFIMSLVFSQVITKPVAALAEGIKRMARGDLSTRVKASGIDEMGRLADMFNQMSEKLENMDSIRNEFVSNASHELKTPLATMKIMLESMLYQEDMPLELRQEFLTDINRELDRLSGIVTDLLTLVQHDSNYSIVPEQFPLRELVEDTVHRLMPLAGEKQQEIVSKMLADCVVYADASKIQQAIYNLINNAIKYTQEGGQIHVTCKMEGKTAVVEVADNGPGIPKKDQPHIFDRFYRVDRARSRATGGNGLGLSIVQQVMLLHNGSVAVFSEEGKGTTFRVELPAL